MVDKIVLRDNLQRILDELMEGDEEGLFSIFLWPKEIRYLIKQIDADLRHTGKVIEQ